MKTAMKRWRGLKTLVVDVVDHGSSAVEKVHLATAKRTFDVLEAIPGIDAPSKVVHVVHDVSVRGVYGMIRAVTHVVGAGLDVALDVVDSTATSRAGETDVAAERGTSSAPPKSGDREPS